MPEMDGFETAALIRERKRSEHTPIIFVTAFNDDVQMAKGYSLGAVDFISTPIDPDVLRTKVGVFVDLYQKTETIRAAGGPSRATRPRASGPAGGGKGDAAFRAVGRGQPAAVAIARFRRHAHQPAPHDCSRAGRRMPIGALRRKQGFWFAHVRDDEGDGKRGFTARMRGSSRLIRSWPNRCREAVESGHAQPLDPEVCVTRPILGPKGSGRARSSHR